MSKLYHLKKEDQELMPLFNGAFVENKPIPFPSRSKVYGYSNLFYWAHLEAFETAEFPLHPHEGFEIMTFVFKGSLEHYDTASKKYTPVKAGGVQVTQAGSGMKHSEKIIKGTHLFQIWFDPDFSKALKKGATYKDYANEDFVSKEVSGFTKLNYLGEDGPIYFETPDISVDKLDFSAGNFSETLHEQFIYSFYLLDGEMKINGEALSKDDFFKVEGDTKVKYEIANAAELFVIKSPVEVGYKRFIERY